MNTKSPTLFQNGVIDIFKQLKAYELNIHGINYNGEVQGAMVFSLLNIRIQN
jgi:hypothetical protein